MNVKNIIDIEDLLKNEMNDLYGGIKLKKKIKRKDGTIIEIEVSF